MLSQSSLMNEVDKAIDNCPRLMDSLLNLIEEKRRIWKKNEQMRMQQESDAKMSAYIRENTGYIGAWVRAYVYGGQGEDIFYETYRTSFRPVYMRGSIRMLCRKHSLTRGGEHPNGWAVEIAKRYIRINKVSCVYREDWLDIVQAIERNLREKYMVTMSFTEHLGCMFRPSEGYWLVRGRRVKLTHTQLAYIRKLLKIVEKFDTIEDRREALLGSQPRRG